MEERISREEVRVYTERWRLANERERDELRAMTFEEKLCMTNALMLSVDVFGWRKALEEEDRIGHERWAALQRRLM